MSERGVRTLHEYNPLWLMLNGDVSTLVWMTAVGLLSLAIATFEEQPAQAIGSLAASIVTVVMSYELKAYTTASVLTYLCLAALLLIWATFSFTRELWSERKLTWTLPFLLMTVYATVLCYGGVVLDPPPSPVSDLWLFTLELSWAAVCVMVVAVLIIKMRDMWQRHRRPANKSAAARGANNDV